MSNAQPVVVEAGYALAAAVENDSHGPPFQNVAEVRRSHRTGRCRSRSERPPPRLGGSRQTHRRRRLPRVFQRSDFSRTLDRDGLASRLRQSNCPVHRTREGAATPRRKQHVDARTCNPAVQDAGELGFTDIERNFGRILNQRAGEQRTHMATTIIASPLTLHAIVAGVHDLPSVVQLQDDSRRPLRSSTTSESTRCYMASARMATAPPPLALST